MAMRNFFDYVAMTAISVLLFGLARNKSSAQTAKCG